MRRGRMKPRRRARRVAALRRAGLTRSRRCCTRAAACCWRCCWRRRCCGSASIYLGSLLSLLAHSFFRLDDFSGQVVRELGLSNFRRDLRAGQPRRRAAHHRRWPSP